MTLQMQNFSKLKGVFPGRVLISRKGPDEPNDGTNADSARPDDEACEGPSTSPSGTDVGTERVQSAHASPPPSESNEPSTSKESVFPSYEESRRRKFERILGAPIVDLNALEEVVQGSGVSHKHACVTATCWQAAWMGVPHTLRPRCWRLLLRYEPPNRTRAPATVKRKRQEYQEMVPVYYDIDISQLSEDDQADLKQVSVDVPRTAPEVPFFQQKPLQECLRRLLYIWGIRHPASGYVQGVNDLVTPFLAVFLSEYLPGHISEWDAAQLTKSQLLNAEADAYWCLCKLVERVQDVYTSGQPGIQRCLRHLEDLIKRVDSNLALHFEEENLNYFQFAFRWINCMLIREIPFSASTRLWDTYLAEGMRFGEFLPYVCAAFLLFWANKLKDMDFQDMIIFLQKVPTSSWGAKELEVVLSHAHMLRASFEDPQDF